MNIFAISLTLISILYGAITVAASILQIKKRTIPLVSSIGMVVAGLLLVISTLLISSIFQMIDLIILSLLLIHLFAIINGLYLYGKLNFIHHLVRLIISLSLIISFYNLYI